MGSDLGRSATADELALGRELLAIANDAIARASEIEVVFVTNIASGDLIDLGPDGVVNESQYYSRNQADGILRTLQAHGFTVTSHFDELSFIRWAAERAPRPNRQTVVFNTAEGGRGEGRRALIPSLCNLVGLPILNSKAHANTLCRHKFHANAVLRRCGVRAPTTWMYNHGWTGGLVPPPGQKVILKPAFESMSIGVADDSVIIVDEGLQALVEARQSRFGQAVIVQQFVTGDEVGVPIVRTARSHSLPVVAFNRADGTPFGSKPKTFADESLRHDVSQEFYECPGEQYLALQTSAVRAFDVLGMAGVGRIDLRVDADGREWVFDTSESPPPLVPTAFSRALDRIGVPPDKMLALWVGLCLLETGVITSRI